MKIIRFLIPLLLIISAITSCKKNDSGVSEPADSSKLLPSVISYYAGADSLAYSVNYYYDNQNRITRQATIISGVITDSKSYNYDINGNLTNIMALSPHLTSYISDTTLSRWHNLGPAIYPITIAPVTSYDTVNYAIRYTNGLPDSAIVTGSQRKQTIKYTVENNKVSTIKISTQLLIDTSASTINGYPYYTPPIAYPQQTVNFTYSGDDITQINSNYTYEYNTHKSAFYNINMKWVLPTGVDNEFYKHDLVKATSPLSLPSYSGFIDVPLEQDYNSIYNKYDYPVQTNMPYIGNENLQIYIKFMKYTYIVAK